MGTNISAKILSLPGQRVNHIQHDPVLNRILIHCTRDRRRKVIDPVTGRQGTVNQYIRRQVTDLPLFGNRCIIEIELAQVWISKNDRRLERCEFVEKGCRYVSVQTETYLTCYWSANPFPQFH